MQEETNEKIIDRRPGRYFNYNIIIDEYGLQLGPIGIALLDIYSRFAHIDTGQTFVSNHKIMKLLNLSEPTVISYKQKLVELKLIQVIKAGKLLGKSDTIEVLVPQGLKELKTGVLTHLRPGLNAFKTNKTNITRLNNNNNNYVAETSSAVKGVNSILNRFQDINPSYQRFFQNKTQRAAAERLLKRFGLEKVERFVDALLKTNQVSFFPVITTPLQLEEKLGHLQSALLREKNKQLLMVKV